MTIEGPTITAAERIPNPNSAAIIRLDRKISNAIMHQRGINLKPEELDVLTLVGAVALLGEARNQTQKEMAVWRSKAAFTPEADSISITSGPKVVSPPVRSSTSAGTTATLAGSSARVQARAIFG